MKAVEIKVSFNITEKDYKSKDFQETLKEIRSGKWAKELKEGNKYETSDFEVTLKTR